MKARATRASCWSASSRATKKIAPESRLSGQLAGFSRLVTDYATFAWLCDVFVLEPHRGQGLGKWLVETAVSHPAVAGLRFLLATYDAHGLYAQVGFESASMMQRPRSRPWPLDPQGLRRTMVSGRPST